MRLASNRRFLKALSLEKEIEDLEEDMSMTGSRARLKSPPIKTIPEAKERRVERKVLAVVTWL